MYVCNVSEENLENPEGSEVVQAVKKTFEKSNRKCVAVCAQLEAEISALPKEEQAEFLKSLGLNETGLSQVVRESYNLLNLDIFFTAGPKETRAWTIAKGATAFDAAGVIHTDFQKGFIRAEVIGYDDYVLLKSPQAAKAAGRMRLEGRDYRVQDGDVLLFRFNN